MSILSSVVERAWGQFKEFGGAGHRGGESNVPEDETEMSCDVTENLEHGRGPSPSMDPWLCKVPPEYK